MRVAHPSFGSRMARSLSEVLGPSSLRTIVHVQRLPHAPHFLKLARAGVDRRTPCSFARWSGGQ